MGIPAWVWDHFARTDTDIVEPRRVRRSRFGGSIALAADVELLESRLLLSAVEPYAAPGLLRINGGTSLQPLATAGPTGYTPSQIRHAYGFDQISFNGVAGDGTGTTIAIVDAYDDPNIASDLHQFSLAYGLPDPPSFTKVNQFGSTTNLPKPNAGWITEIALDVEWAHAIAPGASILLVEARSSSYSDLMTAVNTARNYPGVVAVSMSWGGSEFSSETSYDSTFTTPIGHGGVTFIASSGDDGAPDSYPSSSPNVLSIGGTTLRLDASGNILTETGWSGSGGGISTIEIQPSYQKGVVTQTSAYRANPDVAYDSDPNTGFGVYDSYNNGTSTPWGQWGGTSDAAPQWAALIAIADQGRMLAGKGSLDGATQTLPLLYSMPAGNFHDITSGSSTGTPNYSSGPGYDLVTGRGSPYANRVVNDLVGVPAPPPAPTLTSISTLGTAYPQTPFSITYSTLFSASNAASSNGQPIQFRINSVQSGTVSIVHNNVTSAVVASPTNGTLFALGDTLIWTGPAGVTGNGINAFSVTAFDGTTNSAAAAQVKINVSSLGSQFVLTGPWAVVNAAGATLGLGSIVQTGASLAFVNATGGASTGQYSSTSQITSTNLNGHGSVVGTIDTTTADQGRIVWSDGTVWLRTSLGGQYAVTTPGGSSVVLGSITQSGTSLTLINGSASLAAAIVGTGQLTVTGQTAGATYGDGKITIAATGQIWSKLDLPVNYVSSLGGISSVTQNGTTSLVFVNNKGQSSPGYWINPTQVIATAFGNAVGTVGNGGIAWSTGEFWSESVVLTGAKNGGGTATISIAPAISVDDYSINGGTAHVVQTGTSTLMFVNEHGNVVLGKWLNSTQALVADWGNDVATFSGGKINWSDGSIWTLTTTVAPQITVTDYTNIANGLVAHLVSNGSITLGFINEWGNVVLGNWIGPTQARVTVWGNDVASFSSGRINWSDGSVWVQRSGAPLAPTVLDYTHVGNGLTAHVVANGTSTLAFINEFGDVVLGNTTGAVNAIVAAWNNDVATMSAGAINWSDGSLWVLTTRAVPQVTVADYTTLVDQGTTHLIQRTGGNARIFINESGNIVLGTQSSATQSTVGAWGLVATIGSGSLTWSDSSVWAQESSAPVLSLIDVNGAGSSVVILSPTSLIGTGGALRGVTGTRLNGTIVWSNGDVWDDFDFNALNALFKMSAGYP